MVDKKVLGGFLTGFFLLSLLLSVVSFIHLNPVEDELEVAYGLAEEERYDSVIQVMRDLEEIGDLPLIGSFEFAGQTASTLEFVSHNIKLVRNIYRTSVPVAIVSFIFTGFGVYLIRK